MSSAKLIYREQQAFLFRLMFERELLERFLSDRQGTLDEEGVTPEASSLFLDVDAFGLVVDADLRRDYLMSALLRPFPLTGAALGALRDGPARLSAFLASQSMSAPLKERTAAFGDHLGRLIALSSDVPREAKNLLGAVLAFERGLVDNAAEIRSAVEAGDSIPTPEALTARAKTRRKVALPPYCVITELPVPTSVVATALDDVNAGDCWQKVRAGDLSFERVLTAARALPMPVTRVARGVLRGPSTERAGAGGAAPLVEVSHLVVELSGRRSALFAALDGTRTLEELPAPLQKLASTLLEQGLLALAPD